MTDAPLTDQSSKDKTFAGNGSAGPRRPVLEKLAKTGRKLNRAAGRLLDRIGTNGRDRSVPLFIAGTGAIGGTLIRELADGGQADYPLTVVGACNTRHSIWDEEGIAPAELSARLEEGPETDWNRILGHFERRSVENLIFVDATGSEEVARLYPSVLEADIHIATPSKLANTLEQAFYDRLQRLCAERNLEFRYETTVGAALPVLSTLNDLLETGDRVTEISGVVSGTMTYIFNELEQGTAFSRAVRQARERGYAEPDPRDDLSGEDVARKFLTLARSIGIKIERSELSVETLVPKELIAVDRDTFLNDLSGSDEYWSARIDRARKRNQTLRYVGKLSHHDISVGIQSIPVDSPLGQLRGTDNLFQISTKRYSDTPIVIQGPGAGKEVTAAGVLSDVLKIAGTTLVSDH